MSLSCWIDLGSLDLVPSNTILKEFDGHAFKPHGIITAFLVELCGNNISIEIEVVDASLDYNILSRTS
jgi:hypothetical protein